MTTKLLLRDLEQQGFSKEQLHQSRARQLVWSHDASHFRIEPGATLRAESAGQVARILELATDSGVSVTFRSGGSSLSGQTLGAGLVVDTRTGFQSVLEISTDSITAQPGVTLARLNAHLARKGRKIGPDPASSVASTLGGAVSNNSSGMTCGTKLNSYATIRSARIIFADGTQLDTAAADAAQQLARQQPELLKLLLAKRDQIRNKPELVAKLKQLFSLKNTMGYGLNAFIDFDEPIDILLHLLVGSEGTLAFLSEIELATQPIAKLRAASLLVFDTLQAANDSLLGIIKANPAAIELMDGTSLQALRGEGQLPAQIDYRVKSESAAILVEFEAQTETELKDQLANFGASFERLLVFHGVDGELRNQLWAMRKGLYAIVAKARPSGTTALLEDVAVPPEKLTEACAALSDLCESHGYGKPVIFGHVRDGNIHFMISDDFSSPERVSIFEAFTAEMVDLILALGGNLKAEHGTGRAMAPFVERQFGSELYSIMREIKQAFDPAGILNPGVIFPASDRDYLANLKSTAAVSPIVDACVECGYCESSCPSAGLTLTPRERIIAFRELSNVGPAEHKSLSVELDYQAEQTCAVDGMCAVNCPVGINTGSFVKELRAEKTSKLVGSIGKLVNDNWNQVTALAGFGVKLASRLPALASGVTRLAARVAGPGKIPQWQREIPANGFDRLKLVGGNSDFVFLPSCMNEIFGERQLTNLLALTKECGVELSVPAEATGFCCGTPFSSKGLVEASRSREQQNAILFAGFEGKTVVIDGSSCHQTLLSQSSQPVMELTEFIATHLLDIEVKKHLSKIVLHPTCSGEKTGANRAMEQIANHIAEEVVIPANWRCCGFAGDRGLLVPELTRNATMLEAEEVASLDAVFVSNNQPCQIGMSGATSQAYRSIVDVWMECVS